MSALDISSSTDPVSSGSSAPVKVAKSTDPTIPPLRDVRKFVRRLPRLTELGWVGRGGIGLWLATPPSSSSTVADPVLSPTIGRGRRASAGGGAVVSSTGLKGVTDIVFQSFASHWKDDWAEAAKGFPAWNFEGAAGAASPVRERSELGGGLAVGGSPRMGYSGGIDRSVSGERAGNGGGQDRRRQMSLGSIVAVEPAAEGSSMVGLDLGHVDQGRQPHHHAQRAASTASSPSESLDDKLATSASSSSSTSATQSQAPPKSGSPVASPTTNTRRVVSSGTTSTLPTLASAGSAEFDDFTTLKSPTSPAATATTPPALLSYRDRAALKTGTPSLETPANKSTTTSRGKKILLGGGGGAPGVPTSPPAVSSSGGGGGGSGKHARRASEPVVMGSGGGSGGSGGGGKKVVNSNGWKTQGGGGGKKSGGGGGSGGGKKK